MKCISQAADYTKRLQCQRDFCADLWCDFDLNGRAKRHYRSMIPSNYALRSLYDLVMVDILYASKQRSLVVTSYLQIVGRGEE